MTERGLYVYFDDQRHGGELVTKEELNNECCIADGLLGEHVKDICCFGKPKHIVLEVDKL